MTKLAIVAAAAVLTYASRAAAVVLLPMPRGRVLAFVSRLPAPLFAGLAVFALVGQPAAWPDAPTAAAAIAAIAVCPLRSIPLSLAAGLAAFSVAALLT